MFGCAVVSPVCMFSWMFFQVLVPNLVRGVPASEGWARLIKVSDVVAFVIPLHFVFEGFLIMCFQLWVFNLGLFLGLFLRLISCIQFLVVVFWFVVAWRCSYV